MRKRQNYLKEVVINYLEIKGNIKPQKVDLLNSSFCEEIYNVYKILKGQFNIPPTNFGPWDISANNFLIELDEERHFNRYRAMTLRSPFYNTHKLFSCRSYYKYCLFYESNCLKGGNYGGYWKNNSTERQFIKSNTDGQLEENGSSRWRQRAYYDYLKDISSILLGIPLIRVSIYDEYNGCSINDILNQRKTEQLQEFVNSKIAMYCA